MISKRVCVYCASSSQCDEKFLQAGRRLGEALAQRQMTLVYGGAERGVMGAVANGALQAQGKVIGWIPHFMKTEIRHTGLTELHVVESMHIRKHGMMMNSDAIITLPGATGTLEELMEAITWKRLNLITIPILIVNLDGFYDPLLQLFENMFNERFIRRELQNDWIVVTSVDQAIETIEKLLC
jgi:uncharacterized protein (TIGR00730 family)